MGMTTVQFSASPDCSHNYGIVLPSYMQSFFHPRLEGLSGQGHPSVLLDAVSSAHKAQLVYVGWMQE